MTFHRNVGLLDGYENVGRKKMKILVTTWRHWLPIKILWQGTEIGLTYEIGKHKYYVTCVKKLFAYCVYFE